MFFKKLNIFIKSVFNYLNILSLDAPLVVLFWQEIIATALYVDLILHHRIVLFFSVWLSYSADRFLECYGRISGPKLSSRHLFFYQNKFLFIKFWFGILILAIYLAINFFPTSHLFISINILFLVVFNQFLNFKTLKKISIYYCKDFRTALILSIGCVLYPFLNSNCGTIVHLLVPICLFGIFFGNCKLVKLWEWNLVSRDFNKHSFAFAHLLKFLYILLLLSGIYFLKNFKNLELFFISFVLNVFALRVFYISKSNFENRRILMDQVFWIIPCIIFLFSLCL